MNSREKIRRIFERKDVEVGGYWTGHPAKETLKILSKKWGLDGTEEAIFKYLGDDCRWISGRYYYFHPEGKPIFDPGWNMERFNSLSSPGCFAECESIAELEKYPWPDVKYFDFSLAAKDMEKHQDKMIFTGLWSGFYHDMCDFFGMENYFVKMYTDPDIIHAATEKIVDFYVEANDKMFREIGNRADVMFMGNDLGTQRGMIMSKEMFREFILPYLKRLIEVGKKHNKKIMMHSCGSINAIIPDLIDVGVDILHPIQAQAAGMSAKELEQYKNDLSFVGGLDAQSFFVEATPQQIKDEVRRVRDILGPGIVLSPSHEEVLPNIPDENIRALAEAALEKI